VRDGDPLEPGIGGVQIHLEGTDGLGNSVHLHTMTAAGTGVYSFSVPPGGPYLVCETLQSGWTETEPTSGADCSGHTHDGGTELSDIELRVRALESLLTEKGLVEPDALNELIDTYETKIGPRNGFKVVARAWTDPDFKKRLLEDANTALAEMGYEGRQGETMVVLENTPKIHNMVVCTLCSCYPWPVLGLPPVWYKSFPYRSRAVIDPRGVLKEFGLELNEDVEVRVWDSTSEVRYIVLPERPPGTEEMSEEELAGIVNRNSLIGTAKVQAPSAKGESA